MNQLKTSPGCAFRKPTAIRPCGDGSTCATRTQSDPCVRALAPHVPCSPDDFLVNSAFMRVIDPVEPSPVPAEAVYDVSFARTPCAACGRDGGSHMNVIGHDRAHLECYMLCFGHAVGIMEMYKLPSDEMVQVQALFMERLREVLSLSDGDGNIREVYTHEPQRYGTALMRALTDVLREYGSLRACTPTMGMPNA